jgi:Cys-tRNA(Pro)/Cys-tRNA(Cys) deacylase
VAGRGTTATLALERAKIPFTLHQYEHDPRGGSYGLEASAALGVAPDRVFKTLVAALDDGSLAVGVIPVHRQLDLKALAAAAGGKKASMAEVAAAERATGYVAGGISPVGQKKRLPVVVDASALELDSMFCSGGRRGLEIELAPADLIRAAGATVAHIATGLPAAPGWPVRHADADAGQHAAPVAARHPAAAEGSLADARGVSGRDRRAGGWPSRPGTGRGSRQRRDGSRRRLRSARR